MIMNDCKRRKLLKLTNKVAIIFSDILVHLPEQRL